MRNADENITSSVSTLHEIDTMTKYTPLCHSSSLGIDDLISEGGKVGREFGAWGHISILPVT